MGKSHSLRAEYERISRSQASVFIDLGRVDDKAELRAKLFHSDTFKEWVNSSTAGPITVFLDSLDECVHITPKQIEAILTEELPTQCGTSFGQCFLRLACRDFRWHGSLKHALGSIWTGESLEIYQLAPLTREDVRKAAAAHDLDTAAFDALVRLSQAEFFANSPNTLRALLRIYTASGEFPNSQWELYRYLCLELCSERNEYMRSRSVLTPPQRLAVAGRIAFLTVFTGCNTIDLELDCTGLLLTSESEISASELSGGTEHENSAEFSVTNAAVQDTLATALFSYDDFGKITWTQRTYAEYLAAYHVHTCGISTDQIAGLVLRNGKCVPQVAEPAVWLTSVMPDLFYKIVKTDPQAFLLGQGKQPEESSRQTIVDEILKRLGTLDYLNVDATSRRLSTLFHPELASQLRSFIAQRGLPFPLRRFAIALAQSCRLTELQDAVCEVALDSTENIHIRRQAARALLEIGQSNVKQRLCSLLDLDQAVDPQLDLLGYGLKACYPESLSTAKLFTKLRKAPEGYFGMYTGFLHELPGLIPSQDLPIALVWCSEQKSWREQPYTARQLVAGIAMRALNCLNDADTLESLALYCKSRLRYSESPVESAQREAFTEDLWSDIPKRRLLLFKLIDTVSDDENLEEFASWISFSTPLMKGEDVLLLCSKLDHLKESAQRNLICKLIGRHVDWQNDAHADAIVLHREVLETHFSFSCDLYEHAVALANLKRYESMTTGGQDDIPDGPEVVKEVANYKTPSEYIKEAMTSAEAGDSSQWWHITHALIFAEDGQTRADEKSTKISDTPGWKAANHNDQRRLKKIAAAYLADAQVQPEHWLGQSGFHRPALAGFKALQLLREDCEIIATDMYSKWALEILAFDGEQPVSGKSIVAELYERAPTATLDALEGLLKYEQQFRTSSDILAKFKGLWDEPLCARMLAAVKVSKQINPSDLNLLLSLLQHRHGETLTYATHRIASAATEADLEEQKTSAVIAGLLAEAGSGLAWDTIWPLLQRCDEYAALVLEQVASVPNQKFISSLNEQQLADLYLLIVRSFDIGPADGQRLDESPDDEWIHKMGRADYFDSLRESLLSSLLGRCTEAACSELRRLVLELPHYVGLPGLALRAEQTLLEAAWIRPTPLQLKNLIADSRRRFIQDTDQLLSATVASLRRLQDKLQSQQTPAVLDLWNECTVHKNGIRGVALCTPKSEGRLSDYVKRHLYEEFATLGLVICREVQIRSGELPKFKDPESKNQPRRSGQLIDIYMSVGAGENNGIRSANPLTLIIEVKGCWNKGLFRSVAKQLHDRYLLTNSLSHGLYLVGCYHGSNWPNEESPGTQHQVAELRKKLSDECSRLSSKQITMESLVIDAGLH
jgi:hypothetical protein